MLSKIINQNKVFTRCFSSKNYTAQEGFKATLPKKLSKKAYMNKELKENPEFFKAFPHLQKPMYEHENPDLEGFEYSENLRNKDFFERKELKSASSQEDGYFQSLVHQHNKYLVPDASEKEELLRDNE